MKRFRQVNELTVYELMNFSSVSIYSSRFCFQRNYKKLFCICYIVSFFAHYRGSCNSGSNTSKHKNSFQYQYMICFG